MLPGVNQYLSYLQEFDLSDEQKTELIRTVWFLLESQVNQAFDDYSVIDKDPIPPTLSS